MRQNKRSHHRQAERSPLLVALSLRRQQMTTRHFRFTALVWWCPQYYQRASSPLEERKR